MSAPCLGCGTPTDEIVTLVLPDSEELKHYTCDPCFQKAYAGLLEKRKQFDELIATGVSNTDANKIMIARIDSEDVQ
jgi:hypothetical protein